MDADEIEARLRIKASKPQPLLRKAAKRNQPPPLLKKPAKRNQPHNLKDLEQPVAQTPAQKPRKTKQPHNRAKPVAQTPTQHCMMSQDANTPEDAEDRGLAKSSTAPQHKKLGDKKIPAKPKKRKRALPEPTQAMMPLKWPRYKSEFSGMDFAMCKLKIPRDDFKKVIEVGADFAGINGVGVAMRQLGCPVTFKFLTDQDDACQRMLRNHFVADIHGGDVANHPASALPRVDVYVITAPCQAYSSAGALQLQLK